jgi:Cu+-exporting ATPase
MHPEVRAAQPGICPLCGMGLEPVRPTGTEDNAELELMRRRFRWSLAPALATALLAMGEMLVPGWGSLRISPRLSAWTQLLVSTPVVLWGARPIFERALASVRHRRANMFTLIGLGVGAAYAYSVLATVAPAMLPSTFAVHGGHVPVYFESAAIITVLVLLGQVLELRARAEVSRAVRALLELAPPRARRVTIDGSEEDVPICHVHVGDVVRLRPGEKVPVDGSVIDGASTINEAMLTGEAIPRDVILGARVAAGTINLSGTLQVRAERVGSETLLARIVDLVAEAQRTRAPIQRLADQVSAWFVPAVFAVAALTWIAWALWGPEPRTLTGFLAAISVVIVACPCALGLAAPMSIMVASGRGAGAGVLFRDAAAIEALEAIDTLLVDKTGTLTAGQPEVEAIRARMGMSAEEALRLAASLAQGSEHPLSAAILREARTRALAPSPVKLFRAIPGKGVVGEVEGRPVALGSSKLLADQGIASGSFAANGSGPGSSPHTRVVLAADGTVAAEFLMADRIKPTAASVLEALGAEGVEVVMVSGDRREVAQAVADQLGIRRVEAEVLPQDKARIVAELRAAGRRVAMAGDGINDAPALAAAEVGIAMGSGTDIAMESAGVTLVRGDLEAIVRARRLSRATMHNIRQNLFFALVYNVLGVPIAAGVLYPFLGVLLNPMIAGAAMSLSSVSVIGNALRLRSVRL